MKPKLIHTRLESSGGIIGTFATSDFSTAEHYIREPELLGKVCKSMDIPVPVFRLAEVAFGPQGWLGAFATSTGVFQDSLTREEIVANEDMLLDYAELIANAFIYNVVSPDRCVTRREYKSTNPDSDKCVYGATYTTGFIPDVMKDLSIAGFVLPQSMDVTGAIETLAWVFWDLNDCHTKEELARLIVWCTDETAMKYIHFMDGLMKLKNVNYEGPVQFPVWLEDAINKKRKEEYND